MPTFDARTAKVRVFTEKEGLLSAVAHDLEIDVTDFSIRIEDTAVEATFNARSLRTLHAMKDGYPNPSGLKHKDKADVDANIQKDVLHTSKHGEIRFSGTASKEGSQARIDGRLTLHGTTRSVNAVARLEGASWVCEVPLHQPDYGIKPYSAVMGTLKIKPGIRVRVTVPTW